MESAPPRRSKTAVRLGAIAKPSWPPFWSFLADSQSPLARALPDITSRKPRRPWVADTPPSFCNSSSYIFSFPFLFSKFLVPAASRTSAADFGRQSRDKADQSAHDRNAKVRYQDV